MNLHLNLNYFNTIQGPQIFHTHPEDADENIVQSVANLLNISELIKQKFFVYEGADFKTISFYFEIPSQWARGKKEMLLLSVILPPDYNIENKDPIHKLMETIEAEVNQVPNGYMGFYEYDWAKMNEHEEEIEVIAMDIRKIIDKYAEEVELALKEAKQISMDQIREVLQKRPLGGYVIDDEFLTYLYEIEQSKAPFIRFGDFLESGITVFTSKNCIDQIQVSDAIREIISNFIGNREINQINIDILKEGVDPRKLPSDAKISLLVLIDYLKGINPKEELTIVTPNHNYLHFVNDYFPDLRVLPPSSFFLEIISRLENREGRDYFESLRKKLMNFELQRAITDQGAAASSEQLTWLIEKAIGVASQTFIPTTPNEECEMPEEGLSIAELSLINRYIAGEPIPEEEFVNIQEFEEFLNGVVEAQLALKQIQEEMAKDEIISAQTKIFSTTKQLMDSFLLASATLAEEEKRRQIQILIARFIANFEFLAAISHLNIGQLGQSIELFNFAATFSAIAGQKKKVLISNYLKSITHFFNNVYEDAIHDFTITTRLGARYSDITFQIMCLGGKAISQLLAGSVSSAQDTMLEMSYLIHNNESDAFVMFSEFGDIFYMMGKSEIAIHLYNEALKLAIYMDSDVAPDIFKKIERSFYAVGSYSTPLSAELHRMIDQSYTLEDLDTIEKYNLQIAKLGNINQKLFFEPFPYLSDEWTASEEFDETFYSWLDLLHLVVGKIKNIGGQSREIDFTDLYCYHQEFGGVIVRVPEVIELRQKNTPIIYQIALEPVNSKFKVIETTREEKQNYYSRAIIQAKSVKNIKIRRILPEIFGKFFED